MTAMLTPITRDAKRPHLLQKIAVLERFNGQTFLSREADGTIILGNGSKDLMMAKPGGGGTAWVRRV
jgi:hypothetical protein